jgi:hypothetical protein
MISLVVDTGAMRINNSHEASKYEFDCIIDGIYELYPDHPIVKNRSKQSIKNEWAVHNLLYNLGFMTDRTHSVDFNYPLTTLESITYKCFGRLSMLFIK